MIGVVSESCFAAVPTNSDRFKAPELVVYYRGRRSVHGEDDAMRAPVASFGT